MKKFIILIFLIFLSFDSFGCTQKINGSPLADEKVFDNILNKEFRNKQYIFQGCLQISEYNGLVDPLTKKSCSLEFPNFCNFSLKNYGTALGINMDKISPEQRNKLITMGTDKYFIEINSIIGTGTYQRMWNIAALDIKVLDNCKAELLKPDTGDYYIKDQQNTKPGIQMNTNINIK